MTRVESDHKIHDLHPIESTSRQHGSNKTSESETKQLRGGICLGSGITYTRNVSVSFSETDSKTRSSKVVGQHKMCISWLKTCPADATLYNGMKTQASFLILEAGVSVAPPSLLVRTAFRGAIPHYFLDSRGGSVRRSGGACSSGRAGSPASSSPRSAGSSSFKCRRYFLYDVGIGYQRSLNWVCQFRNIQLWHFSHLKIGLAFNRYVLY